MQEEVNEKVIALSIKGTKLTAELLQKSMKFLLSQIKKQTTKAMQPRGKQTLKQLMKQNAGVSNIEITDGNIKAFESTAKKYGIDFALKKHDGAAAPVSCVFQGAGRRCFDRSFLGLFPKEAEHAGKALYPADHNRHERKGGRKERRARQAEKQGKGD